MKPAGGRNISSNEGSHCGRIDLVYIYMHRGPMPAADVAFIDELRFNDKGLIPAIAQDWLDGAILMQAWMNRAALELTLSTGTRPSFSK